MKHSLILLKLSMKNFQELRTKMETIFESIINGHMKQARRQFCRSEFGATDLLVYWNEFHYGEISIKRIGFLLEP